MVNLRDLADQLSATQIYAPAISGPQPGDRAELRRKRLRPRGNVITYTDVDGRGTTCDFHTDSRLHL